MLRLLLRVPFAGALTVLLVLQSAPVRAQDTRVRIMDDGVTQGASTILNCTGGLGCTVADGIAILAGGAGEGGGMADPGANGIVKRVAANITTPASPGTDYVLPSGSITGNAATATALAADPADCTAGNAPLGITATGAVTGCFDVIVPSELTTATAVLQPLDADLTTLAGKTLVGTGATVRFTTGTFTAGNAITTDANGNLIDTGNPVSFLTENSVTNAILADMAGNTIKGRLSTTGDPQDLTGTQLTTLLDIFTSSLKGLAPASGGGTTNFLRADGTWAAPPGGGAGSGDALTSSSLAQFAPTTSAELAGVMTNETGSGSLVFATSPVFTTPNLGTPSVLDLVNATGLPVGSGLSGLGANVATWLQTPSSANLAATLTGETGTGAVVFGTNPTLNGVTLSGTITAAAASTVDLSAATLTKLFAASGGAAPTTDNDCQWDTTAHRLKCGENGVGRTVAWTSEIILNTSAATAPAATDDAGAGYSVFSRRLDTTTGIVWVATDVSDDAAIWVPDNDTDTDNQTLQEVANQGRTINDASSLATAVYIGKDDGDGNWNEAGEAARVFYTDVALGSVMRVIPDGNMVSDVPSGFNHIFQVNGVEAWRTTATQAFVFAGAYKPVLPVYWDAGGVTPDGTNCGEPTEEQVNSGPRMWNLGCQDGGDFHGRIRLTDAIDTASTVTFRLALRTIGTSSLIFASDVSMMCRSVNDTLNNTWSSVAACDVNPTGTSANLVKECVTTGITPNGTCAAGDWLFWRLVIRDAANTVTAANAKIYGGHIGLTYAQLGD